MPLTDYFKNSKEIRNAQRILREQNKNYGVRLIEIPREQWPPVLDQLHEVPVKVWRSCDFLVQEYPPKGGAIRLSIIRTELAYDGKYRDGISWDDLQGIKNQCGYTTSCAVEIFPPQQDIVNACNMRHLWVLGEVPPFVWRNSFPLPQ